MNQPQPDSLFNPADIQPPVCTACQAQDPLDCRHNRDIEQGLATPTRRRPRQCLLAYDPATAPFPEGY